MPTFNDGPIQLSRDAFEIDLSFVSGDYVTFAWTALDVDWRNPYTAQIRTSPDPTSRLLGTFTVTTQYYATATPEQPIGTLFTITMDAADNMVPLTKPGRCWYWDCQESAGGSTRWRGKVWVTGDVTKSP